MIWNEIKSVEELNLWKEKSKGSPVMFFKHSTRCSISSAAKARLERSWEDKNFDNPTPVYLDLIAFRDVSNQIAQDFGIEHQSPQVLVIKDGVCVYDTSHYDINYADVLENSKSLTT